MEKRWLIKLLGIKQKVNYYDMFLVNDDEVKRGKPSLVRPLAPDMDIELYLVPTNDDPVGYAKAVIVVKKGNRVFRTKYDSGRVFKDAEAMLQDCIGNIHIGWDLKEFRKWANEAFEKETSWLDKWAYGI